MKKIVFVLLLIAVFGGIQVVSANGEAPVAVDDCYSLWWDMAGPEVHPPVLQNDYDPNDLPLTAELVSGPKHGRLRYFNPYGGFWYLPDWYFLGEDTFTYRVYNGYEYSEPACVKIIMGPAGGYIPDTTEDAYMISADTTLAVSAPGILGNDYYDFQDAGMSAVLIQSPEHGILCLNSDGSFSYTPDAGFVGTDNFLYVAENEWYSFWFSYYTPVTITVHEPVTPVPEFPGMFVVIGGIILGTAFIAARMRIHR
ncbi:Ig-like domain-containing protein [Methanogenium cariaci]|jgi:Big-like domain-containing protein